MQRLAQFARLGFLAVLIAILGVGPLLHAHMGTPLQSGFHLDLPMRALSRGLHEPAGAAEHDSAQHNGGEPFAVEMEKGVKRASHDLYFDAALIESLLALCAAVVVAAATAVPWPVARIDTPYRQRWRGGSSRPPPAQAPPL
jgi:hypothetical protein